MPESLALTMQRMPATKPTPAINPPPGTLLSGSGTSNMYPASVDSSMKGEPGSSTSATRSRGSSCPRLWKRSFAAADAARVRSSSARIRAISASIPSRLVLKAAPDGEMVDSITAMDSLARYCERSKAIHALGAPRWIASLAMTALMLRSENLPRFRRAGDLAAGAAGTAGDLFDQLAVRRHLGAVGEIERIFEACAQMAAKIGAALVQRPDLGAAD